MPSPNDVGKIDPRIAYYFGHTEALALMTKAHALASGQNPAGFHAEYEKTLRTERPQCKNGECVSAVGPEPLNSVIPCRKGIECNWPACPQSCTGRPGRG
ncbi:MAG: hypothetical protein JWP25_8993 [Bradyrhizobium sp.]|nr:hypothetical protein [Bradyrhizobium sp.]